MCCLVKCLFQFFLILLNLCLLLVSAAFIFFGVMITWFFTTLLSWFKVLIGNLTTETQTVINDFLLYIEDYANSIGIVLLVIGGIVFIISLVGFLGLCFKSVGLTIAYSTLIGLLAAGVITLAIITIVDFSLILSPLTYEMSKLIRSEFEDPDNPSRQGSIANIPPVTAGLITILRQFECCGVESYKDFQSANTTWTRNYAYPMSQSVVQASVPVMCCRNRELVQSTSTNLWYYVPGTSSTNIDSTCMKAPTEENSFIGVTFTQYLETVAQPIGWIILGVGGFVILIFIAAVALTCSYKKRNSVGSYV